MIPLEDRVVPTIGFPGTPAVTAAALSDAAEGGTAGVVQFTRDDTSGTLTVTYTVGGTATSGADYTALGGSATFPTGVANINLSVGALHDGILDPDETVTLTVTSGTGYTVGSPSSAAVNLIDTDILPVAFDGLAKASENNPATVAVLDLATSLYGDPLTAAAVTKGAHGTVVLNTNGTVTYTPNTDFSGDDSFTYTVEDPFGNEATGTVFVTILSPQAPPTSLWTATNTAVSVVLTDLAFDPDGDTLTATAVTQGTNGTVNLSGGTATYTPSTGFTGDDHFTYTVEDPDGNEATNTITVTVGPIDPVAIDGEAATDENTAVVVEVLDLVYQPASSSLTVTAVTQGSNGSVAINTDGTVTYTPDTGYTGTDTFTYTVTDGSSHTGTGTITVQVGPALADSADEIIDEASEFEDEIDNYDVDSPPDLTSLASALTGDVTAYLASATSVINTNSVDVIGSNMSYKDFLEAMGPGNQRLYSNYRNLLDAEATLWSLLGPSKGLLESLAQQLKAAENAPKANPVRIAALKVAVETLKQVYFEIRGTWLNTFLKINPAFIEAFDNHESFRAAGGPRIPLPPTVPNRIIQDTIPKLP